MKRIETGSVVARLRWGSLLRYAEGGTDVIIKRYSKPIVVAISYADYELIREKLAALRAERQEVIVQ